MLMVRIGLLLVDYLAPDRLKNSCHSLTSPALSIILFALTQGSPKFPCEVSLPPLLRLFPSNLKFLPHFLMASLVSVDDHKIRVNLWYLLLPYFPTQSSSLPLPFPIVHPTNSSALSPQCPLSVNLCSSSRFCCCCQAIWEGEGGGCNIGHLATEPRIKVAEWHRRTLSA